MSATTEWVDVPVKGVRGSCMAFRIDVSDLHVLDGRRWYVTGKRSRLYVYGRRPGQRDPWVILHRVLLSPKPGQVVDHINGDTLDNRRCNLRTCTMRDNSLNALKRRDRNGSSRFKGVMWSYGRWAAKIKIDGRVVVLGRFTDEAEAARAYDDAARLSQGEFARLNFPRDGERSALRQEEAVAS